MPPNTILLSEMMRELSAQPGFTEAMLAELDKNGGKKGPALLTPRLVDELRKRILGKDWQRLDRFPGWTMREINPTVGSVYHFLGKHPDDAAAQKAEGAGAVHPGSAPLAAGAAREFLETGSYALDKSEVAALYQPSTLPAFTTDGIVTTLGAGVVRGDGPNELAPEHAASQRLAYMLNRLAANPLGDGSGFRVKTVPGDTPPVAGHGLPRYEFVSTPQDLIAALAATGHTVTVQDARYFANFGHFHYTPKGAAQAKDVMMPFWVNSGFAIPGTGGLFRKPRPLLVPVSHAEYEWHIRGPLVNADVSYYYGVDGKSEWRTMDTLDQAWVLKRNAHTYVGADAVEVTRLVGLLTVAYMRLHAAHPELPFGGYYTLGVCQDGVAAIEKKMTGTATLFPNTADDSFFTDPRDGEVNALIQAIPKDREGAAPGAERIFGSLPTEDFSVITIPGLADDLQRAHDAWTRGRLRRMPTMRERITHTVLGAAAVGALAYLLFATTRKQRRSR